MDRKSIIVIAGCMVALVLWVTVVMPKYTPPRTALPAGTNAAAASQTTTATTAAAAPTTPVSAASASAAKFVISSTAPEELLVLTNENARYVFTSYGGGLKEIELVKYPEKVSRRNKTLPPASDLASLNTHAPAPVMAILGEQTQGGGPFVLTRTAKGVRAVQQLTNGLELVKEFALSSNYLLRASVAFSNTSSNSIALDSQQWIIGTSTPMDSDDNGQSQGLMWYDGAKKQEVNPMWFDNRTLGCIPGTPRTRYEAGASNVVWAAVQNQFFALVAMPKEPAQQIISDVIPLPRPGEGRASFAENPAPKGYATALVYPAVNIPPGTRYAREFNFFAGPKEYQTLARIGQQFGNNVDLVMGFGGFFGFFAKALLLGMNWLHEFLKLPYAWAIIAITVLIKAVFWPLTAASTRSMKRMQALQPQMKAIQEKYKDDQLKAQQKTMEFMKQHKVSPLSGCLPMLVQMPVFFGFVFMVRTAIELRGAHFFWISDLSKPDTLFTIPGLSFIPVIGVPGIGLPFNLLPLIMGATMLWQAHLTPPSPGVDPAQQKMMRYMPLLFMVFFYNNSAGLALYWTVSNLLTILQTKITRAQAAPAALTPAPKKSK